MPRLSSELRPVLPSGNSSSSSLNGMEIASPNFPPGKNKVRKTASYHSVKPLPPTPTLKVPSNRSSRAPSAISSRSPSTFSLSSVYTEEFPPPPKYASFKKETTLPSSCAIYNLSTHRSSTSKLPVSSPQRPKPRREVKTQEVLQKPAAVRKGPPESIFSEWRAPRYEERGSDEIPKFSIPIEVLARKKRETQHIAEQHAAEYTSILPRSSSILPRSLTPSVADEGFYEPYYEGHHSLPTPMSPRITDVVDETLVPRPLRRSTALDSNTSSHFSSSSSELMPLRVEGRESLTSRAKKAFHSRKFSQEKSAKKRSDSTISSKSESTGRGSKAASMTASERASIQNGIIDMYDTLTNLYDPQHKYGQPTKLASPPKPKPTINIPSREKNTLCKEHRSPAFPRTPYYKSRAISTGSVESPLVSPRSKSARVSWFGGSTSGNTPKRSHFSLSSKASSSDASRASLSSAEKKKLKSFSFAEMEEISEKKGSVGGKLKKAVGIEGKKGKKGKDEKRREDMKKRIKIVRSVTDGPF